MVPEADTGASGACIIGTDQSRLLSWSSGSGGLSVKVMSCVKLEDLSQFVPLFHDCML